MKKLIFLTTFIVGFIFAQATNATALWVGQSYTCDASSAVMGLTSNVSWTCNGGYISMSGTGFYRNITVTQYFSGPATIKCTWKYRLYSGDQWRTQSKSWTITCNDNPCSISPTSMALAVGESDYIGYSLRYSNSYTSAANVYYSSSNPNIAEVDRYTGKVTARNPGTTYITCYSKVSANSPYCTITVKDVKPTGVSLPSSLTVNEGANSSLSATLMPSNAQSTFSWWSDDKSIATVSSSSGNTATVYGKKPGNTKIYVRTANGHEDYCNIVVRSTMPTGLSITEKAKMKYGAIKTLKATMSPSYAVSDITWESDNEAVVAVSQAGVVTAIGEGRANITATAQRGGYKAKCSVTVTAKPTHFVICLNDGERVAFALENSPKVVNGDGTITVIDKGLAIEYPLENVHKYVLGVDTDYEIATKIEATPAGKIGSIRHTPRCIILSGFKPNLPISIYNISGRIIHHATIGADGNQNLPLAGYATGVYIVKTGNQSFKFKIR